MYLQRDSSRDLFEFQKLSDKPNVWGSSWGHDSNHLVDGFSYRKRRISSAKARGQQCQPLIPAYRMLFPKNMYILPPSLRVYSLNSERYLILSIYILQMINWINKQQQSPPFWKTNNPLPQPPKRRVEPTVSPSGRRWWHWRKSPHPSHSRDRRVQGLGSIPEDSSWKQTMESCRHGTRVLPCFWTDSWGYFVWRKWSENDEWALMLVQMVAWCWVKVDSLYVRWFIEYLIQTWVF